MKYLLSVAHFKKYIGHIFPELPYSASQSSHYAGDKNNSKTKSFAVLLKKTKLKENKYS